MVFDSYCGFSREIIEMSIPRNSDFHNSIVMNFYQNNTCEASNLQLYWFNKRFARVDFR